MIKKLILISICILYFCLSVISQVKIQASIVNNDNKAIAFANIFFTDTSKGTMSNIDGMFELAIPNILKKRQISFSCIGYKSAVFSLDSLLLLQKKGHKIKLVASKVSYNLQEINVARKQILKNAKQIMSNAIDRIPDLLAKEAYIGKYYLRQTHKDASKTTKLLEAAISIYDPGISSDIRKCKFNIDQLQTSIDNRIVSYKILLNLYSYMLEKKPELRDYRIPETKKNKYSICVDSMWENPVIQNYLNEFFDTYHASLFGFFCQTNMIRSAKKSRRKKSDRILPERDYTGPSITSSFIKEHSFKLDTILMYNNEAVYKIKILPNKNFPHIKYYKNYFLPVGWAIIRLRDFAFMGLDYAYIKNPNIKKYCPHFIKNVKYLFKCSIKFKEYKGKLYTSYLSLEKSDYNDWYNHDYMFLDADEKNKAQKSKGRQIIIQEIINTDIITNTNKISEDLNQLEWIGNQYEQLPFNKDFWDKYSSSLASDKDKIMKEKLLQNILEK